MVLWNDFAAEWALVAAFADPLRDALTVEIVGGITF